MYRSMSERTLHKGCHNYKIFCLIDPFQDYKRVYKPIDVTCIVVQEVEKMLTLRINASTSMLLYFIV